MIEEPGFMHEKPDFAEDSQLGYDLSRSAVAADEALDRLLAYLRRLRRTGAQTRDWTRRTKESLDEKLATDPQLNDLTAWESHILQVIRHYMQEVSDTINRIKTLNPPLTTNQLRPFIQAAEKDRNDTIDSLAPLTSALEELTRRKDDLASPRRPEE